MTDVLVVALDRQAWLPRIWATHDLGRWRCGGQRWTCSRADTCPRGLAHARGPAVGLGMGVDELARMPHAYPTYAGTLVRAAVSLARATHRSVHTGAGESRLERAAELVPVAAG